MNKIPKSIQVGGVKYKVSIVDSMNTYGEQGNVIPSSGEIKVAKSVKYKLESTGEDTFIKSSEEQMFQTFIHECVHTILDAMGEYKLSENEKFVCTFSGFANELIQNLK